MDLKLGLVVLLACTAVAAGLAYALVGMENLQIYGVMTILLLFFLLVAVIGLGKAAGGGAGTG